MNSPSPGPARPGPFTDLVTLPKGERDGERERGQQDEAKREGEGEGDKLRERGRWQ